MKKKIIFGVGAVAIIIAAFALLSLKKEVPVEIKTVTTEKGSISKFVTATGTVEPINQVEVGTQVSGVIEKIYVDYNSKVKANQLIAELDKTALSATVAEATASLNTALNEQDYQQKNYDRIARLHDTKVVSDTDYEEALYKLNNAKGIAEQRKSDLQRAKTNLRYASIYSPIDGVVISRSVDVGQTVAASYTTPTLFTIAQDLSRMQVEADVDEADIGQVKVNQRVTFTVDAYPDDLFNGTVTQVRLEPIETSNVITYTVIIRADNNEGKLMPGLTASISIVTAEVNDVVTVQSKTLNFQPDEKLMVEYAKQNHLEAKEPPAIDGPAPTSEDAKMVWVKEGNNISPRKVMVGFTDGVYSEVLDGLKSGEEVVYAMEEKIEEDGPAGGSPFMPKPPAAKKR